MESLPEVPKLMWDSPNAVNLAFSFFVFFKLEAIFLNRDIESDIGDALLNRLNPLVFTTLIS